MKKFLFIVAMILVNLHDPAQATPPFTPDRGRIVITEECLGVTTEVSVAWVHPNYATAGQFYLITEFDVKRNSRTILTEGDQKEIVFQLNRWLKRYVTSIGKIYAQCQKDVNSASLFITIVDGEMNRGRFLLDTMFLNIDPADQDKTGLNKSGLYVARTQEGKNMFVPAASADIPPARTAELKP